MSSNLRFIRWQAQAMAQMSVLLALLGGIAIGGLGLGLALVQKESFQPQGGYSVCFLAALVLLCLTAAASVAATITRLLDFRLTAQKVRQGAVEPITFWSTDAGGWGRATWRLLWAAVVSLLVAAVLLSIVLANAYLGRFIGLASS